MNFLKIIFLFFSAMAFASPHALYFEGAAPVCSTSSYSILTLNACMMDGDLPTRFGGMVPASDRIDRLADFILQEDPDLFLGQEIMSGAGRKLVERLQGRYAYFWVGIGNIPGREESGLFVASKRPVRGEPQFTSFTDRHQVNKGFFPNQTRFLERGFFYLDLGDFVVATTHLEGGGAICGAPLHRIRQMQMLTDALDLLNKPYIVAGDLNLDRTGRTNDEYGRSNIARDYFDFYTLLRPEVNETTYTCTNLFTAIANGSPLPTKEDANEIDDYFLIRKPYQDAFDTLEVVLIKDTYDTARPREQAITDHRAYKATFSYIETCKN